MQNMSENDTGINANPEIDPEDVIRELSEEEILFMQMIGGAKGGGGFGG